MGCGFSLRKQMILECLQKEQELKVSDLVTLTGVAIATVRRDLLRLEQEKLIVRTFGGIRAVDKKSLVARTFEQRESLQCDEKKRIANAAAELVMPGMTIAVDSGTTCMNFASALKNRGPLRIVTSALAVIETLGGNPDIEIILVGGRFRVSNLDFYGTVSIDTFRQFYCDMAFMGCDAFQPGHGAFSLDQESAAISRTIRQNSSKLVLLCDNRKIGSTCPFLTFTPQEIDTLVTDCSDERLNQCGCSVIVAR
jgi:DeoR family fructose operon transcriptional repressor